MLEYELFHERVRRNDSSENNNVLYVSTERFHFLLVSLCSLSRFFVSVLHRTDAASQGAVELPTTVITLERAGEFPLSWDGVTLDTALFEHGLCLRFCSYEQE